MQYFAGKDGKPCALGRMGDQLIAYAKAKWFSHKYSIPYLYRPFPYAEYFALSTLEPNQIGADVRIQEKTVAFDEERVCHRKEDNVCYAVNYFYSPPSWEWNGDVGLWSDTIRDEQFLHHLREMISPNMPIPRLEKPEGIRTVAVHIRKGSFFDTDGFFSEQEFSLLPGETPSSFRLVTSFMDVGEPYKFPPNQYYIDQIRHLSERFCDEPLHVILFTDYHDPEELLSLLKSHVAKESVSYAVASHVTFESFGTAMAPGIECSIRDLFLMTQCDCLIRSGSNFSQLAHLLGDYEVVYFPLDATWYGNRLTFARIGRLEK